MALGDSVTLGELEGEPHELLARLRSAAPVAWIPALGGWLVTRYDLAVSVMRDAETFTVDDPRFSTAQVIGPSMLSLDGDEHVRHRGPFVGPFRPREVRDRFADATAAEAIRLITALGSSGAAELRTGFAGPLAASIVARALGVSSDQAPAVLEWYRAIVSSVTSITAGHGATASGRESFAQLRERLLEVTGGSDGQGSLLAAAAGAGGLSDDQIVSNAAVLLFGGIETTEGMIANAALHLLKRPDRLSRVRADPGLLDRAIEESLRLEPAAAVVDRYATANVTLAGAEIRQGELVRVSIAAANRDPAVFADPDRFDPERTNARRHLAFAQGPHVCVGVHLARLEARVGLALLLSRLPGLRLDPDRPAAVRGLVFRKPDALHVRWDR
jgi:cytochrome P450